jgi:hypothetical protein
MDIPGKCLAPQPSRDQPGRDSISTVNPNVGALLEGSNWVGRGRQRYKAANLKRWQACQPIPSLIPLAKRRTGGECSLWLAEGCDRVRRHQHFPA